MKATPPPRLSSGALELKNVVAVTVNSPPATLIAPPDFAVVEKANSQFAKNVSPDEIVTAPPSSSSVFEWVMLLLMMERVPPVLRTAPPDFWATESVMLQSMKL